MRLINLRRTSHFERGRGEEGNLFQFASERDTVQVSGVSCSAQAGQSGVGGQNFL